MSDVEKPLIDRIVAIVARENKPMRTPIIEAFLNIEEYQSWKEDSIKALVSPFTVRDAVDKAVKDGKLEMDVYYQVTIPKKVTKRKRVYIACPLSVGDLQTNINKATDTFYKLMKEGISPFCPAWSCFATKCEKQVDWSGDSYVIAKAHAAPNNTTADDWLSVDLAWVEVSEAVLRIEGYSKGADREVAHAMKLNIPVFYTIESVIEWSKK